MIVASDREGSAKQREGGQEQWGLMLPPTAFLLLLLARSRWTSPRVCLGERARAMGATPHQPHCRGIRAAYTPAWCNSDGLSLEQHILENVTHNTKQHKRSPLTVDPISP